MVSAEKASSAFPLLRIEALEKRFGDQHVLRGIDIDVGAGETVVVIGASGSGKTTLLRCLNHLETPDAGAIWLDGETIGGAFTAPPWRLAAGKPGRPCRSAAPFRLRLPALQPFSASDRPRQCGDRT